jgi:hypothetical protein
MLRGCYHNFLQYEGISATKLQFSFSYERSKERGKYLSLTLTTNSPRGGQRFRFARQADVPCLISQVSNVVILLSRFAKLETLILLYCLIPVKSRLFSPIVDFGVLLWSNWWIIMNCFLIHWFWLQNDLLLEKGKLLPFVFDLKLLYWVVYMRNTNLLGKNIVWEMWLGHFMLYSSKLLHLFLTKCYFFP